MSFKRGGGDFPRFEIVFNVSKSKKQNCLSEYNRPISKKNWATQVHTTAEEFKYIDFTLELTHHISSIHITPPGKSHDHGLDVIIFYSPLQSDFKILSVH